MKDETTTAALSPIGLGCSRVGSFNNPASLAGSQRLIEAALDLGITVLDTANIYGQGDSERVIGRAIRGRRDAVFVMTKIGKGFSAKMRLLRPFKPLIKPLVARRMGHESIVAARAGSLDPDFPLQGYAALLDASLRRLRTDHVDALFLHGPPLAVIRDPRVVEQLAALRNAGKVVRFGVSVDDAEQLEAALTMPGIGVVQLPWSMMASAPTPLFDSGLIVVTREVIGGQPDKMASEAIGIAAHDPRVTTALVGTTSRTHLEAAVMASR